MSEILAQAAQTAVAVALRYARSGTSLARVALAGSSHCVEFQHYPAKDVVDVRNGCRFYYHVHTSSRRPAQEHGHFHLFAHGVGEQGYAHLGALSLDDRGVPLRWFVTNGWVTGESLDAAARAADALARFRVDVRGRMAPLARWLTAMVCLYADDLRDLQRQRDAWLAQQARTRDARLVWEDRNFDVVCECPADWMQRLARWA
ncbi:MAG: hypothetical protein Fur007_10380 [Rhodoferax sp.]